MSISDDLLSTLTDVFLILNLLSSLSFPSLSFIFATKSNSCSSGLPIKTSLPLSIIATVSSSGSIDHSIVFLLSNVGNVILSYPLIG